MTKAETYQKILDDLPKPTSEIERFDYNKYEKEHPDTRMFSWTSAAMNVWHFITSVYNTGQVFMPPLHIHKRKAEPSVGGSTVQGGMNINYAWFNGETNNDYALVMPVQYECNIYQKNFLKCIKERFGTLQDLPAESLMLFMSHILIHEFVHYLCAYDCFSDMYTKKEMSWKDRCKMMKDHVDNLNTFEDEKEVEKAAIEISTGFAFDFWSDKISDVVYYTRPIIGGPFDLRLRKSSDSWNIIASTLEILEIERFMIFEDCSDEADIGAHLRKKELVKWLKNYAKVHNDKKWALVI